jgi:hypothetical protein
MVYACFVVAILLGSSAFAGVDIRYRVVVSSADGQGQDLISPDPVFASYDGKEAGANTDFVNAATQNPWHEEWGLFAGGNADAQIYFTPDTFTRFHISFEFSASSTNYFSGWSVVEAYVGTQNFFRQFTTCESLSGLWSGKIGVPNNMDLYFGAGAVSSNGEGVHHDASIYNLIVTPIPIGGMDTDSDVDGSDLALFISAYFAGELDADMDGGGFVDVNDFVLFAGNYGTNE